VYLLSQHKQLYWSLTTMFPIKGSFPFVTFGYQEGLQPLECEFKHRSLHYVYAEDIE
jgi:hypothetical protein